MIKNIQFYYFIFYKYIFYFFNTNTKIYLLFFSKLYSLLCVPFIFYLKELPIIDEKQKNKYMPCKAY